jgi:hypothetical protein
MDTFKTHNISFNGNGHFDSEDVRLSNDGTETYGWLDTWNMHGFKAVSVDNAAETVSFYNFVDVNIHNTNTDGATVYLGNVKRADISLSDGDDSIFATISSNKLSWSNLFSADTGAGDDSIVLMNSLDSLFDASNSKYTSLDIDMGTGNDEVSINRISDAFNSSVTRHIDGGDGTDVLHLGANTTVDFENFEAVFGKNDEAPTAIILTEDNLIADHAVLLQDIDLDLSDFSTGFSFGTFTDSSGLSWAAEIDQLVADFGDATDYTYVEVHNNTTGEQYFFATDDTTDLGIDSSAAV